MFGFIALALALALVLTFVIHWFVRAPTIRYSNPIEPEETIEYIKDDFDDFEDLELPEELDQDQALANSILKSCVTTTFHDPARTYLPEKSISKLISLDTIGEELEKIERSNSPEADKYDREFRSRLALWILKNARKVFAITIQSELEASNLILSMRCFRKYGFGDDQLPIESSAPSTTIFPRQIWTIFKLENFYRNQWQFLAPVFTQSRYDYDLLAECIFPFTLDGAIPKDGAFSSVYRVKIHKDHQEILGLQDVSNLIDYIQ